MFYQHNWLIYELPPKWCYEEDNENLFLYNPKGKGAITISFLNVKNADTALNMHISIIANNFILQNNIKLSAPLILHSTESKTTLSGSGTTEDGEYIKLSIVAKHPKIALVTYQSERENSEVKDFDSIVNSMHFSF